MRLGSATTPTNFFASSSLTGSAKRLAASDPLLLFQKIPMDEKDPVTEALADAEAKLQKLKSQDQLVTEEAREVFAELGTRVDAVLEERRSGRDRRATRRELVEDRRRSA